jgi:autophagy-related protein 5
VLKLFIHLLKSSALFPLFDKIMDFDDQIQEEVWKGAFPLRISLSTYDLASTEHPADFYRLVPRCSYLPQLLDAVKSHFEPYAATDFTLETIWFSYNSLPLKWHYPLGLLVDIHSTLQAHNIACSVPFHVEVHFHRFPSDSLLPYQGLKSLRSVFQNTLKEACALLLGTSGPVMSLSRDQEDSMWRMANSGEFKGFKEIGADFMKVKPEDCRYVPVKVFYGKKGNGLTLKPISGVGKSVGELVREVFQEFLGKIVVQGVIVPEEAELFWLWRYMAHPDNFLYITLLDLPV